MTLAFAGTYQVGVWAQNLGPINGYDAYALSTIHVGTGCGSPIASPESAGGPPVAVSGATVRFTVAAYACAPNAERFQFWLLPPGGTWRVVQAYSGNVSWDWFTGGSGPGTYQIGLWEKDVLSPAAYDHYSFTTYVIKRAECAEAQLFASTASPQKVGATVTFVSDIDTDSVWDLHQCTNEEDEFWLLRPGSTTWTMVQPYSVSYIWQLDTTGLPPGAYRIGVWERQHGSTKAYESYAIVTLWVGT